MTKTTNLHPGVRALLLMCAVAGATLSPSSEAAARKERYCVANSSTTYGLYTNDVYYSPQCDSTDRKCLSREHYFSFVGAPVPDRDWACTTMLTVEYDQVTGKPTTAELHGLVDGNKNNMVVDVDLKLSGLHKCTNQDPVAWPRKWGSFPSSTVTDSVAANLYCATTISDAAPDGYPEGDTDKDTDGGFGDYYQDMDQRVAPTGGILQIGLGGNGLKMDVIGAYAKFQVTVNGYTSPKTWELGMTLTPTDPPVDEPPPQPTSFDIVLCPSDANDDTGTIPGADPNDARQDCTVCWYGKNADGSCNDTFVTTFRNEPDMWGRITLDGLYDIPDPRAHCNPGVTGPLPHSEGTVAPGVSVTILGVTPPATKPGLRISGAALTGDIDIPWYVCGIPRASNGLAFIRLINADSDFSALSDPNFRDVINSVVSHDADGTTGSQNPAFGCNANEPATNRDPVVAWLPRTDEIPLPDASRSMRDVTSGCGSTRGGTSTRSYLLSNLVYDPDADFRAIIGAEIDMIETTLVQAASAVDRSGNPSSCFIATQSIQSILFPDLYGVNGESRFIDHVRNNFNDGNYGNVIQKLEWLLGELGVYDGNPDALDDTARLYSAFDTCYYDSSVGGTTSGKIMNLPEYEALKGAYPTGADAIFTPRNFRGDLQAQTEHVIWNIKQNLLYK